MLALSANYGGAGVNVGSFNSVYEISCSISFPIFTGGRICADIDEAEARLNRRKAEYEDLKGRVAYDVRVAWLDLEASDSAVRVAEKNEELAERALAQSRDRYANGVTNYLCGSLWLAVCAGTQRLAAIVNRNHIRTVAMTGPTDSRLNFTASSFCKTTISSMWTMTTFVPGRCCACQHRFMNLFSCVKCCQCQHCQDRMA